MSTIRKHGTKWQAQVRLKDYPAITRSFHKKSDAKQWAITTETDLRRGITTTAQSPDFKEKTLADLFERYKKEITPQKRGKDNETGRIIKFIEHPMSKTPIRRLTTLVLISPCYFSVKV